MATTGCPNDWWEVSSFHPNLGQPHMTLTSLENGEPVSKMSVSYIFLLGHPLLETLGWGGQHTKKHPPEGVQEDSRS